MTTRIIKILTKADAVWRRIQLQIKIASAMEHANGYPKNAHEEAAEFLTRAYKMKSLPPIPGEF